MSQTPSTPVKVPSSAASYTPATLDPDLRSQINTILLRDGHITKIQDALLHALNSNNHNWPSAIQSHALSLLRSGEITTFPALLTRVLDDVRTDAVHKGGPSSTANGSGGSGGKSANTNGSASTDGINSSSRTTNGAVADRGLAVPEAVIEEALKVARGSLEAVCELEESGTG